MNRIIKTINKYLLLLAGIICFSCGSDGNEPDPTPAQSQLILRTQSIADNASVDASTTSTLTLSYNNLIEIKDASGITLNDTKTDASTSGMDLIVDLKLEPWKEYTLKIASGAIAVKGNDQARSEAKTIIFNTRYGKDPNSDPTQDVAKTLINANATKETVDLYNLLLANYGKKIFSGTMGGVALETGYYDLVANGTGISPAIIGFDFIHLGWSPANWIDYTKIDAVKAAWDNNKIVSFCWHWNVPDKEANVGYVATYNAQNYFSAKNALTPGTWENDFINKDIEKVASHLKMYQDAGIPILWRPLHEAAGDYKWGAWFWWGKDGIEATKELWVYLYNKLTHEYGINNLIWVWTMQCSDEGKPASVDKLRAAYPGDEYVDMVGADIYPQKVGESTNAQFELMHEAIYGKKMLTLSEVGLFPDFKLAEKDGCLWSYFMQWYDDDATQEGYQAGVSLYNTMTTWKSVMSEPIVLNQR
ncbi:MAG: glycoside hydrolase family 26 protein [Muribaculaceae bacterium]|nr:glycoside hydrolase family 26 protein [Muribaculaceae bacterium]